MSRREPHKNDSFLIIINRNLKLGAVKKADGESQILAIFSGTASRESPIDSQQEICLANSHRGSIGNANELTLSPLEGYFPR